VETLKAAPTVGARESARRDIHRILPRYHRRDIEVEIQVLSTTTDGVRRDPVNGENTRRRERTDKAADMKVKSSQLGKDSAVTGWLGESGTRCLTGCCRWRECRCRRSRCCWSRSKCCSGCRSRRCARCEGWCWAGRWLHLKRSDVDATVKHANKSGPALIVVRRRRKIWIACVDGRAAR